MIWTLLLKYAPSLLKTRVLYTYWIKKYFIQILIQFTALEPSFLDISLLLINTLAKDFFLHWSIYTKYTALINKVISNQNDMANTKYQALFR